jgi:predicted ribosome quality control (RQC) complex YloA/Tae2 family protein
MYFTNNARIPINELVKTSNLTPRIVRGKLKKIGQKQITALEIHYLLKELKDLVCSKIDRIYQPTKNQVIIQLHIPGKGKKLLFINIPNLIFVSSVKKENPKQPFDFCVVLRKYLNNTRLKAINQKEFERIIEFEFEKQNRYYLIIELFSKGNIVLCDSNYKIINCLEIQKWKDRTIKKGEIYNYPKKEFNFLKIKKEGLKELIKNSKRDSVVKILAVELGLGGIYSEEVCLLADIDKNKKELKEEEIEKLLLIFKKIKNNKIKPMIVYDENNHIVDIVVFDLRYYNNYTKKYFKTFNSAFDYYFSQQPEEIKPFYEKEILRLKDIIKKQEEKLEELKNSEIGCRKKGELIYNNYSLLNEILTELKKARQKYSWKEIKERLKGHNIIKEINEKNKEVVVEI